jgi:tetratricopeptide (TPR) repeat protein
MISRTAIALAVAVGGIVAAPAVSAPTLDSLRLPKKISAQQGHARFLVGVRLSEPAKLTVQVVNAKDQAVVQTITDSRARPAGRAYLRIEAVDNLGYQLPAAAYRIRIQAIADNGDVGTMVEGSFRLTLNPPHGRFDAYAVPLWKVFRSQNRLGARVAGQFVAVVGPRGPVAQAGLRRGDVITHIGGTAVDTPGAYATALRAMPAEKPVAVTYLRAGRTVETEVTPRPDWEAAPDYGAALAVATRRVPKSLTLAFARVREHLDNDEVDEARALLATWPKAWRQSAPGQYLDGELLAARDRWKQALGAYNRALKKETSVAAIELGRAISLMEMDKARRAIGVLKSAERIDPKDAEIAGYQAYAYLRAELGDRAVPAAQRAVSLDRYYADGYLPLGIALLSLEQRAPGVQALRRGLILLEDADRANRLIATYLNPTDP